MDLQVHDVVVIGGGAAGLVAAAFASTPARPAVLVERTSDGGRKILISGGGRCNVLPAALEPERFVTSSPPHLVRHMLRAWPLEHQKRFFEDELGVPLAFEAGSRKYFPASNRARDVRDALVAQARRHGVDFRFDTLVTGLEPIDGAAPDGPRWRVETSRGVIDARSVIVATGGLSVPATGSDGAGLRWAERLGHTVHPTYAALAPIVASPHDGKTLYFVAPDRKIMAVDVVPGPALSVRTPRVALTQGFKEPSNTNTPFDVLPDGRFLGVRLQRRGAAEHELVFEAAAVGGDETHRLAAAHHPRGRAVLDAPHDPDADCRHQHDGADPDERVGPVRQAREVD